MSNKVEKANMEFFNFIKDETLRELVRTYPLLRKPDIKPQPQELNSLYEFLSSTFEKNYHLGYRIFEKALLDWENSHPQMNQKATEKKK